MRNNNNNNSSNNTVDRILLWHVPTNTGVQLQMIAAIRQIHDRMITYVRFDDGILSVLFEKGQGLRRGRVISRHRYIVFAAVLTVVLQRFGEDTVIVAELVHLKHPPASMRPKAAMDYVRRVV